MVRLLRDVVLEVGVWVLDVWNWAFGRAGATAGRRVGGDSMGPLSSMKTMWVGRIAVPDWDCWRRASGAVPACFLQPRSGDGSGHTTQQLAECHYE